MNLAWKKKEEKPEDTGMKWFGSNVIWMHCKSGANKWKSLEETIGIKETMVFLEIAYWYIIFGFCFLFFLFEARVTSNSKRNKIWKF